MKRTKICTTLFIGLFCSAFAANAQFEPSPPGTIEKQKIQVELKITPSESGFKAEVVSIDSSRQKVKLWICNAEERKCTVTIRSSLGYLWSQSFREAYWGQVFNFSLLDDGIYTLHITNGRETFEKKILINTYTMVRKDLSID